jgi:hypothetical protein
MAENYGLSLEDTASSNVFLDRSLLPANLMTLQDGDFMILLNR